MLEKLINFTHKIQELGRKPNYEQGFDYVTVLDRLQLPSDELQGAVNAIIDALKSVVEADSGADNIGVTAIAGLNGATVQTLLESLKTLSDDNKTYLLTQIQNIVLGQIPDGTITDAKMSTAQGQLLDRVASHLADNVYQLAGGTATAITLTGVVLEDGHPKTFISSTNNSGSATTINGKPLYKPNTTNAPTLVSGKAYTVWYNLAGDCFFIKASAEGDAGVADVLATKKFSNDNDTGLVGTMPNKVGSGTIIIPNGEDQAIPQGYYDGTVSSGKVSALTVTPGANILYQSPTSKTVTSNVYTISKKIKVGFNGMYRVSFACYADNTLGRAQIYKNGVAVGIERPLTNSFQTFTEDISANAGDTIEIWTHESGTYTVYTKDFKLMINETIFGYVMLD